MLFLQPLLEFLGETDNFPVQGDKFDGELLQFVKHCEGFLLGESRMDCLDRLVIVHTYAAVFALQVGQLDIIVRCRLVYFHHLHRFVEEGSKDELGFGFGSRVLEKPFEFDVLELVQTESVIEGMKLGFLFRSPSSSSFAGSTRRSGLMGFTDLCHTFKCFIYSAAK